MGFFLCPFYIYDSLYFWKVSEILWLSGEGMFFCKQISWPNGQGAFWSWWYSHSIRMEYQEQRCIISVPHIFKECLVKLSADEICRFVGVLSLLSTAFHSAQPIYLSKANIPPLLFGPHEFLAPVAMLATQWVCLKKGKEQFMRTQGGGGERQHTGRGLGGKCQSINPYGEQKALSGCHSEDWPLWPEPLPQGQSL